GRPSRNHSRRRLFDANQAQPSPADRGEPRSGRDDRSRPSSWYHASSPPVEPGGRGARIEISAADAVMLPVLQNGDETVSHLARRPECPRVIATSPDASAPPDRPIDSPGEPDDEPLHASRERPGPIGLDDQVKVAGLHGEVKDAESTPRTLRQAVAERLEELMWTERG